MLKNLTFSDIYVGQKASFLGGVAEASDPIPAPPEVQGEIDEIRNLCVETHLRDKKNEFALRYNDTTYRASVLQTIAEQVFVLRRFAAEVPDFTRLGISNAYVSRLLAKQISGLIIVAGAYGQGKTTTASALLLSRLKNHGGVGITIEDPPEMPMEGKHGEGVCYQTWVEQGGFAQACRNAARWAPSIIFLGEVRDSESAIEALRASINGRLVICTFHADNVIAAFERFYSLAVSSPNVGNSDDIASLMSHGIHSVMHQRLEHTNPGEKMLRAEALFVREPGFEGCSAVIRARRFEQLGSDITRQSNLMLMELTRGLRQ